MKIGSFELELGAPNERRLAALSGCSPAVMLDLLQTQVLASTVASAVLACVPDGPGVPERHLLAQAVTNEGADNVRAAVRDHYWRALDPEGYAAFSAVVTDAIMGRPKPKSGGRGGKAKG